MDHFEWVKDNPDVGNDNLQIESRGRINLSSFTWNGKSHILWYNYNNEVKMVSRV